MYIILVSSDGNGAGEAYGPYDLEEHANADAEALFSNMCEENEWDPNDKDSWEYIWVRQGPWYSVLEIHSREQMAIDEGLVLA